MNKTAVIADSNSGITKEEAQRMGIWVVPMPFIIDSQIYYEGVDLFPEQFYKYLREGRSVSTSQPAPDDLTSLWDSVLAEGASGIVYIPMSSGLSSSCQTAAILAAAYEGRVQVADNHQISVPQKNAVRDALALAAQGLTAAEIKERLEEAGGDSLIYIGVDTLEYLKRGGRVSSVTAFAGTLLGIKPVVAVQDGEVEVIGKARGSKKANNLLTELIEQHGGVDFSMPYVLGFTGMSDTTLQKYIADSAHLWRDHTDTLPVTAIGSVIGTHVGPGAVGVAFFSKE